MKSWRATVRPAVVRPMTVEICCGGPKTTRKDGEESEHLNDKAEDAAEGAHAAAVEAFALGEVVDDGTGGDGGEKDEQDVQALHGDEVADDAVLQSDLCGPFAVDVGEIPFRLDAVVVGAHELALEGLAFEAGDAVFGELLCLLCGLI